LCLVLGHFLSTGTAILKAGKSPLMSRLSPVTDYLDSLGYYYSVDAAASSVLLTLAGKHCYLCTRISLSPRDEFLSIQIRYPFLIRAAAFLASAGEMVNRANSDLPLGSFVIDPGHHEVHFHIRQFVEAGGLATRTVGNLLSAGLRTADRYFPSFMLHLFAGYTPGDAIFLAELDSPTDTPVSPRSEDDLRSGSPRKPRRRKKGPGGEANSSREA
jgi:hypothetical protein